MKELFVSIAAEHQAAKLDQADLYLGKAGKLDSDPPGPLKPRSGWVSEVLKVFRSVGCCLFIMLCVFSQGSKQEVNLSL